MTLDLLATHGTCNSYANLICEENFKICDGRHGAGVYFWDATNFDDAVDLARSYAEYNFSKGSYSHVDEKDPCVLVCNILLNKINFLDLESLEYLSVFRAYLLRFDAKLKLSKDWNDIKAELTKIYNGFFHELEQLSKEKILVYHVKAAAPDNYKKSKSDGLKWATQYASSCLVVRENSVIPLTSIRRV